MNFYKVIGFIETREGRRYRESNPECPWGCEFIPESFIEDFLKRSYQVSVKLVKRDIEDKGENSSFRRRGVFDSEMNQIPFEKWLDDFKPFESLKTNGKIAAYNYRFHYNGFGDSYFKSDSSMFDQMTDPEDVWSFSEGYHYLRVHLSSKFIDLYDKNFIDKYYIICQDTKSLIQTDPWFGYSANLSYIENKIIQNYFKEKYG